VSFNPGVELVMEAWTGYWAQGAEHQALVLRSLPEERRAPPRSRKGEVDIAYLLTGPVAEDVQRTPGFKLVAPRESQGTFWLDLPDQWDPKSPWHDKRVRQAASFAIDRKALNQAETLGFSYPTGSLIRAVLEFSKFFEPDPYDPGPGQEASGRGRLPERLRRRRLLSVAAVLLDGRGARRVLAERGDSLAATDDGARRP